MKEIFFPIRKGTDESVVYLDKAKKMNLKDADILNRLGNAYQKSNSYDEAIKMYDKALAIWHDDADALYNKACCKVKRGDLEKNKIKDDLISAIMINRDYERRAKEDKFFESIL